MKKPMSPCAKPECFENDKIICSATCEELKNYQRYLMAIHDPVKPPAIDLRDYYTGIQDDLY